ncbi:protein tyrosine phosphatase domain-containing protein 1-like isoform X3 [Entelurus aequoreus]|nr:protein tyrosine phosphatase domain-containing protein 1-like isoform X3 [Entelurus aequoreus]
MQTLTQHVPFPRAAYSQARENLVKAIPPKLLCLLACGGLDCRYEGPDCWKASQQVIRGIFSSWVTDDIIAMARPSTILIEKFDVIEQFQRLNIRSIINMQVPGEHAHCGPPLDPGSGFTYLPQIFMENDTLTAWGSSAGERDTTISSFAACFPLKKEMQEDVNIHPSIHFLPLIPFGVARGAGAYLSYNWAEGGVHPGQVATSSQRC